MRIVGLALAICVSTSGCAWFKGTSSSAPASHPKKLIVTPETGLAGQVVKVNPAGRFVVLTFPLGRLPAAGQTFYLYRKGLKVAEVRTTQHQQEDSVVADLISGDAQPGDEARDK